MLGLDIMQCLRFLMLLITWYASSQKKKITWYAIHSVLICILIYHVWVGKLQCFSSCYLVIGNTRDDAITVENFNDLHI
jgi:hypothetical protein